MKKFLLTPFAEYGLVETSTWADDAMPASTEEHRAVVTYDHNEIRLYIYHGSDRLSVALSPAQAVRLGYELIGKSLETAP